MQTIAVDLKRSPEIADAVVDLQPGDEVCLHATIKAKDDQTLTVTVEELSVPDDGDGMDKETSAETTDEETGNEGSGDVVTPPGEAVDGMGREMAAN